jgi:DNA-binding protein H-NS
MEIDLSTYSTHDLKDLQRRIELEVKTRVANERASAIERIFAIAASVGLPVDALIGGGKRGPQTRADHAPKVVRFRHPDDSTLVWSGRGPRPPWVHQALQSGMTLPQMQVSG